MTGGHDNGCEDEVTESTELGRKAEVQNHLLDVPTFLHMPWSHRVRQAIPLARAFPSSSLCCLFKPGMLRRHMP